MCCHKSRLSFDLCMIFLLAHREFQTLWSIEVATGTNGGPTDKPSANLNCCPARQLFIYQSHVWNQVSCTGISLEYFPKWGKNVIISSNFHTVQILPNSSSKDIMPLSQRLWRIRYNNFFIPVPQFSHFTWPVFRNTHFLMCP